MVSEISNEIGALDPQEELPSQDALTAELEEILLLFLLFLFLKRT